MFELTINDKVYPFRFGMGFLREINKRVEMTFDEDTGAKRNIGLYYTIIDLMDGVLETLEDVLHQRHSDLVQEHQRLDHHPVQLQGPRAAARRTGSVRGIPVGDKLRQTLAREGHAGRWAPAGLWRCGELRVYYCVPH